MGLLLLLTSALLHTCLHSGRPVSADPNFRISSVDLTIHPSPDVDRNTNVTLRCKAVVVTTEEPLSREFIMYKDERVVYRKTVSSSEDFLYHLPEVRVSNNGKYKCKIKIMEQEMASSIEKLTVTGLSLPVLHLSKSNVTEGEDVTATCSAPGETGSFYFHFFDNSRELHEKPVNSNQAEAKLSFKSVGRHSLHCSYTVVMMPKSVDSEDSNTVNITVKEISIMPVLEISPLENVFEGDNLTIRCSFVESEQSFKKVHLILSQGTRLLSRNISTTIEHKMMAEATNPVPTFECTLVVDNVVKVATQNISVMDLFSVPTLRMSPNEVFQEEPMNLICTSERVASERLNREDLVYTLDPAEHFVSATRPGVFALTAMKTDFSYTCLTEAKGIKKRSKALTVRPKVHVSVPDVWVSETVILGKPFFIYCESKSGSLPIAYTLWKGTERINTFHADSISKQAYFPTTVNHTEEIRAYRCEASNGGKKNLQSAALNTTVIEPVAEPFLSILVPNKAEIFEGIEVYLSCIVKGTPPITFQWYHVGKREPLQFETLNANTATYQFTVSSKEQGGMYSCTVRNRANNEVESNQVFIEVRMALWKKGLIGGFLLLLASILILVGCVVYFKSKRGPVAGTVGSVWSHRKPDSEADEEFSTVSNEPEVEYTEVVHPQAADPVRGALTRKGTDTVYSELQNAAQGAADHHEYVSKNLLHVCPTLSVYTAPYLGCKTSSAGFCDHTAARLSWFTFFFLN
ncbi:platelet endothelial cell adhesion molecule isoform X3 [Kryptolebias marmoratus]|uniref:platelet endothelial cell adhesion molecule isoform X3 n=1 Tax=Kryptolebias marmoratus TaxID=37003 RepID=UPI0018AD0DBD|nr:platelet endothelial cell adhesion molecule isoform X3 [Kryptolebias marmoratus]